jgi:hypothetical protein
MWESPSVLCGGFFRQLVEIFKKKLLKAAFVDFHSCGIFHSRSRSPSFRFADEETDIRSGKNSSNVRGRFKPQLIEQIEAGTKTPTGFHFRTFYFSTIVKHCPNSGGALRSSLHRRPAGD